MSFALALGRLFQKATTAASTVAQRGGAVARAQRETVAKTLERGVAKKGAGLPTTAAAKASPPRAVRVINAEKVSAEASRVGRADLKPAVKPLAIGAGATATLAAAGYAIEKTGEAAYRGRQEQLPYTQELPGGGLLYSDPVTGETYVIVTKEGGASIEDAGGQTPTGGYDVLSVSQGNRADARSQESLFAGLFSPWVLVALGAVAIALILYGSGNARGGAKA